MAAGESIRLFYQDARLLLPAERKDFRLVVVTDKGPRHYRWEDLNIPSVEGLVSKSEMDKALTWRLQVVSEQAFNRALEALQNTGLLFEHAPVFPTYDRQVVTIERSEPAYIADRRDFVDLTDNTVGLSFICGLKVHQGRIDWRGRYSRERPEMTPPPAPLETEHTVEQARAYAAQFAQWREINVAETARMERWAVSSQPRLQRNDGSRADTEQTLVVLREELEGTAAACGVSLKLPETHDGVAVMDPSMLVPALITAVQELNAYLTSDALVERIANAMAAKKLEQKRKRSR